MKPIWFFVGLVLMAMGGIITLTGIYLLISGTHPPTALAHLHPDIWWGAFMIVSGLILLNIKA